LAGAGATAFRAARLARCFFPEACCLADVPDAGFRVSFAGAAAEEGALDLAIFTGQAKKNLIKSTPKLVWAQLSL